MKKIQLDIKVESIGCGYTLINGSILHYTIINILLLIIIILVPYCSKSKL